MKFSFPEYSLNNGFAIEELKDGLHKTFRSFYYLNDFFITINKNGNGKVVTFTNNQPRLTIENTESNLKLTHADVNGEFIAMGVCSNTEGKIKIYNYNSGNLLGEVYKNKPYFGNRLCFVGKHLYTTYCDETHVYFEKYYVNYTYDNFGSIVVDSTLQGESKFEIIKNTAFSAEAFSLVNFTWNDTHIFAATPADKAGKIFVMDHNLNLIQTIYPPDTITSNTNEFDHLFKSGFGVGLDSSDTFLAVGAPFRCYCFKDENVENSPLECKKGVISIYSISEDKKTYNFLYNILNPVIENEVAETKYGLGLSLHGNDLYTGDIYYNGIGKLYHYKLANEVETPINLLPYTLERDMVLSGSSYYGTGFDVSVSLDGTVLLNVFEKINNNTYIPTAITV